MKFSPVHQRRHEKRRHVDLACEAVADADFRRVGERLMDLSKEGALLRTYRELSLGDEILLAFQAPRTRQWIDARGIVVRKIRGVRKEDRGEGVGLFFLPLEPMHEAVLNAALERVPPTLPARPRAIDYAAAVRAIGHSPKPRSFGLGPIAP
jgi:hypothetical protein